MKKARPKGPGAGKRRIRAVAKKRPRTVKKRHGVGAKRSPAAWRRRGRDQSELARIDEIRAVAARFFREKGYHAATLREIAQEVGIEAPSLYNHFPSKQELLTDILVGAMEDVIEVVRAAVEKAPDEPVERLEAATIAYVRFHADRLIDASISDTELRALEPQNLERVIGLRHELGLVFKDIIREGVRTGAFRIDDAGIGAMAVLSICARLPSWYRPRGRLDLDRIARLLADCVVRAVGGE